MKHKKKYTFVLSLLLLLTTLMSLSSCSGYDEDRIIGKTSSEVEEMYGAFDYIMNGEAAVDGNYYSCRCCYLVKDEKVGFFGTDPAEYVSISFDEEGKAYEVEYPWYIPGG